MFLDRDLNMEKVIILVDGQNLYYNLAEIGLKERDIDWNALFNSFLEAEDKLIRAYWFRAAKLQDGNFSEERIRQQIVYKYYRNLCEDYKTAPEKIKESVLNDINAKANVAIEWLTKQRERFSSIEFAYDQLCLENRDIEIVKSGVVKVDPYKRIYLGEKGVDIALAVKMISLSVEEKCDKIILISGDYDYTEAIRYVKGNMTKMHIVKFHKGVPPSSKSMSRDLSVLADHIINIYEEEIIKNYLRPQQTGR